LWKDEKEEDMKMSNMYCLDWIAPQDIDLECKNLCIALNALPGIETDESCCGHGKESYRIWFRVTDYTRRGFLFLSRLMCTRYYNFLEWQVTLQHSDSTGFTRKSGWRQIGYLLEGPPGSYTFDGKSEGGFAEAESIAEIIRRHISKKELGYNLLYHSVNDKTYDEYWENGKKAHDTEELKKDAD
jgi:hypothetical protein